VGGQFIKNASHPAPERLWRITGIGGLQSDLDSVGDGARGKLRRNQRRPPLVSRVEQNRFFLTFDEAVAGIWRHRGCLDFMRH